MRVLSTMSRDNRPGEVQKLRKTLGVKTIAIGVKREIELTCAQTKQWKGFEAQGGELVGKY